MRESKDDGIAYEDLLTLNQPPDQTNPTIPHQVVIRSNRRQSHDQSSQNLNGPIDDHQHRHLYHADQESFVSVHVPIETLAFIEWEDTRVNLLALESFRAMVHHLPTDPNHQTGTNTNTNEIANDGLLQAPKKTTID